MGLKGQILYQALRSSSRTILTRSRKSARFDEARASYEEGQRLSGGLAWSSFGFAHLAAATGNQAEALRILNELVEARQTQPISAWGLAVLHASLGDVDDAFAWLDVAVDEKAPGLLVLRAHPRLDPIRNDPRYLPLVERVGLNDQPTTPVSISS